MSCGVVAIQSGYQSGIVAPTACGVVGNVVVTLVAPLSSGILGIASSYLIDDLASSRRVGSTTEVAGGSPVMPAASRLG